MVDDGRKLPDPKGLIVFDDGSDKDDIAHGVRRCRPKSLVRGDLVERSGIGGWGCGLAGRGGRVGMVRKLPDPKVLLVFDIGDDEDEHNICKE